MISITLAASLANKASTKAHTRVIEIIEQNRLGDEASQVIKQVVEIGYEQYHGEKSVWYWIVMPKAAKYLDMINNSVDKHIALSAFMIDLMKEVDNQ